MSAQIQKPPGVAPIAALDWRQEWPVYGVYTLCASGLLLAAFSRGIVGLKPSELLLIVLAGALCARRIVRRDLTFATSSVDLGFAMLIVAGTWLPLTTLELRHIYLTAANLRALLGPIEYYLWYRVCLEALPLPSRLPGLLRVLLLATAIVSLVGVLQVLHFPGVEHVLVRYFPTYDTFESQYIRRATSLVGGWEPVAALSAYSLILINQLQLTAETTLVLGRRWGVVLLGMMVLHVVAIVATLSTTGIVALVVGYGVAWRLNGRLARSTRYALLCGIGAAIIFLPFILQRYHTQWGMQASQLPFVPQTWQARYSHWGIVLNAVFVDPGHLFFGVQPGFAYPVLSFGSTESLFLLALYRGGVLYLGALLGCMAVFLRALLCARRTARGFARDATTAIITIFIVNSVIDVLDAHLFGAGEFPFLFTLLAVGVGLSAGEPLTMPVPSLTQAARDSSWREVTQGGIALVVALALLTGAIALRQQNTLTAPTPDLSVQSYDPVSATTLENQRAGTSDWQISPGADTSFIQGYASATDVVPGDAVTLAISAQVTTRFTLDVYRVGWYYGLGGRRMLSVPNLLSAAHGYWTPATGLRDCATCILDPATHLLEPHWTPTYALTLPHDWPGGVYLLKLTATAHHAESYVPLVVRSPHPQHTILASLPTNTYQALNPWGGYSLAVGDPLEADAPRGASRAQKVSFDRPLGYAAGAGDLLNYDIHTVRWLERLGFDTAYTTNGAIDRASSDLAGARIFLALGRDSYWTAAMRATITAARDVGTNLAFFGAHDAYWQVRLEADAHGQVARTLVCYKVHSVTTDLTALLANDPLYATAPALVTAPWRDPALGQPESALVGIMAPDTIIANGHNTSPDWIVSPGKLDVLEQDTGLHPGEHLTHALVGGAFDSVPLGAEAPANLVVLARSSPGNSAATTYYRAASGAFVFAAGMVAWSWNLDEMSLPSASVEMTTHGNQALFNLTINIIHRMVANQTHAQS